ncbi:hypothetical protein FEMY_19510 [Ferrovum myxofaciens]|uniref:Uncharacterized protein n=1 Tax=Ferrovum myxofaciens TaxID=416213 RepID=A0A149VWC5_9PROT|nr:hypothetical protein [Ferrovum myxofaciens]KXW57527.1 hypothetical protein FEMY_19510 [Ferrovum myxofaciens]
MPVLRDGHCNLDIIVTVTKPLTLEHGAVVELVPTPAHPIRLHTLDDIRLEMAKVYRGMRSGSIDPQDGTRLAFVLGQMVRLFEQSAQDRRLEAIEQTLNQRKKL